MQESAGNEGCHRGSNLLNPCVFLRQIPPLEFLPPARRLIVQESLRLVASGLTPAGQDSHRVLSAGQGMFYPVDLSHPPLPRVPAIR